jgi:hypothetical protein
MANLNPTPGWDDVPQIETTTVLKGGPGGALNAQAQALMNRLEWMRRQFVSAKDPRFSGGAKGDGTTDDTAAIQAALDYVEANGGGYVWLPNTSGKYRITTGLKTGSFTTLIGNAPVRYPFNGVANSSALMTDFSDPNQNVIEAKTKTGGAAVAYNVFLASGLPDGATYNCGVMDLLITVKSGSAIPYAGIKFHGCPGSVVRNVGIVGTGAGMIVNECYGGEYQVHSLTLYYGFVAWGEVNACTIDAYCTQDQSKPKTVPAAYRVAPLSTLNGSMASTLKLSTEAHSSRPFGIVFGSHQASTSSSNQVACVSEYFNGGLFTHNARGLNFTRLYAEGDPGDVAFAVVSSNSTISAATASAYLSGGGTYCDVGANSKLDIRLDGVISYSALKPGPVDISSQLTLRGVSMAGAGQAKPEVNVFFPDDPSAWVAPTLGASWTNAGGPNATAAYRFNARTGLVELKGYIINGVVGGNAFVLPAGFRPSEKRNFVAIGGSATGYLIVLSTGEVIPAAPTVSANGISLDGIAFKAEQ